jgi:hypothetical protein
MRDTLPCMLDGEEETFIVKLGGKLAAKFYTPRWFHPVFPFAKDKEAHTYFGLPYSSSSHTL